MIDLDGGVLLTLLISSAYSMDCFLFKTCQLLFYANASIQSHCDERKR